jgi:hypothetical protein
MRYIQQSFRLQDVFRAVLITLITGWLAALIFGLWIARLQYNEVSATLPNDRVAAEYEARIDRELHHGLLLFLPQVGVMTAIVAWQIALRANRTNKPRLYGAITGASLATIQSIIALVMQVPWIFIVVLWVLFIGTGTVAVWFVQKV